MMARRAAADSRRRHLCLLLSQWRLIPQPPVSILFEYYSRERRMRVMRLFAEGTFDVDNALKNWLEEVGPDRIHNSRSDRRSQP
jgi:hypothetical protein